MNPAMLTAVINTLLTMLPEEKLKEFADMALDFVENKIDETETQWDDAAFEPVIALLRKTFDIPDND